VVWLATLLFVALLPAVHFLLPGPQGKGTLRPAAELIGMNRPSAEETPIESHQDSSTASVAASGFEAPTAIGDASYQEGVGGSGRENLLGLSKKDPALQSVHETGVENGLLAGKTLSSQREVNQTGDPGRVLPMIRSNWRLTLPDVSGGMIVAENRRFEIPSSSG
jgi:hypothetical protein